MQILRRLLGFILLLLIRDDDLAFIIVLELWEPLLLALLRLHLSPLFLVRFPLVISFLERDLFDLIFRRQRFEGGRVLVPLLDALVVPVALLDFAEDGVVEAGMGGGPARSVVVVLDQRLLRLVGARVGVTLPSSEGLDSQD